MAGTHHRDGEGSSNVSIVAQQSAMSLSGSPSSKDDIRGLASDAGFATVRIRSNMGGPARPDALDWTVILSDPIPS